MSRRLMIGVMGSGSCDEETSRVAAEVGRGIAEAGAVLVCGGLGGVMESACRGAQQAGGLTLGILPGESSRDANPFVDIALPTDLGHARNVINIWASDAVIAIRGEYGTLSEIAIALKVGVPVIGLGTWSFSPGRPGCADPIKRVSTAEEAVRFALDAAHRATKD